MILGLLWSIPFWGALSKPCESDTLGQANVCSATYAAQNGMDRAFSIFLAGVAITLFAWVIGLVINQPKSQLPGTNGTAVTTSVDD
jgi:hypothetical protein